MDATSSMSYSKLRRLAPAKKAQQCIFLHSSQGFEADLHLSIGYCGRVQKRRQGERGARIDRESASIAYGVWLYLQRGM